MLGLHTGPSPHLMRGATANGNTQEGPLSQETVRTILRYLLPPNGDTIPSPLLSQQLLRRHHFLSISASDPESYLFLNPDKQDTACVLSTLRQLSTRNINELIGRIAYFGDGEELIAHVILGEALCISFSWERDRDSGYEGWRYRDVTAGGSLPDGVEDTVEAAKHKSKSTTTAAAHRLLGEPVPRPHSTSDDAYWARYDTVAPSVANGRDSANGSKVHLPIPRSGSGIASSQRSMSPRVEDAYWDRYGYGEDSDEDDGGGAILVPQPARMMDLKIPQPNQFPLSTIWSSTSEKFNPDDLSEALAMHLQPDHAPSSNVAQALSLNLNTPPQIAPHITTTINLDSPPSDQNPPSVPDGTANAISKAKANGVYDESDKAVLDTLRGVFHLWKSSRQVQGKNESLTLVEEKDAFLSLVSRSLADL